MNRAIVIAGGASIRQDMWNTPINNLPLWDVLKDEFTIGTNWTFKYVESTVLMYSDYQWFVTEKENLKDIPLILGKEDGYYHRKDSIQPGDNVILLKECDTQKYIKYNELKENIHPYYWGKEAWERGWYCYDKETEVLTDNGWRLFKDLNDLDKIATLNSEKNIVEYQKPIQHIKYFYNGEMVREKNKRLDLLVTPNHRMYLKKGHHRNLKNYFFEEAKNLENYKEIIYRTGFPYKGRTKNYFTLPELKHSDKRYSKPTRKILMNNWLEFLGWYLSEGSYYYAGKGNYRVVISQSEEKNPIDCKQIESMLERCGFKYYKGRTKTCTNYTIYNKQLFNYVKQFGHSHDKFIAREYLNLNKTQLNILIDILIKGDGSINKKSGQKVYFTASKKLANDICELALKCGYVPYLYQRRSGFTNSLGYVININKTPTLLVTNKKRERIPYNDHVYCVEVPNHIIYVRRKGHSCWSGNCSQLIGIKALNLAVAMGCEEIYLLGFDACADSQGKTHFYQDTDTGNYEWNNHKCSGIGKDERGNYKTGNYNKIEELNRFWFQPFEKEFSNGVKILNVSLNSKIDTFPKISYETFYKQLQMNKEQINHDEIRNTIRNKLCGSL